jgi:hypothetical protein
MSDEQKAPIALAPRPTAAAEARKDCIEMLKKLLAEAEAGEIAQLAVVYQRANRCWGHDMTTCDDLPAMLGRITIATAAWMKSYLERVSD